jgi:predicted transcriptional regulator
MALEIEILNELRQRLDRLERTTRSRRGSLNQKQAAEYLNRSEEWLRREHALGRGPKRRRRGTRFWDYDIADLDSYREFEGA